MNKNNKFIKFALKYQLIINILFFILICLYAFLNVNWMNLYNIVIDIPSNIKHLFFKLYELILLFLNKFYLDITTFPTNIKIISVGILKRFVIEDIIIPIFIKFYFNIIKEDLILYYKLRYREFKKIPIFLRTALSSPIFASIVSVISYFKIIGIISFWIKKILTNTIFSKLKFVFITWLPAIWIIILDLPFISIIIDYLALSKILSWINSVKILNLSILFKGFIKIIEFFDDKIFKIHIYFKNNIGLYLRNKAIMKKYSIQNKINTILKNNKDDYHVLSKNYNNKEFKNKIIRLQNIQSIRLNKIKQNNKLKTIKLKNKILSIFTK